MSYAQGSKLGDSSKSSQTDIAKACLKLVAEVEAKDREISALKADKADLGVIRQALTDKAKLLEKIIELYESDLTKLRTASSLDAQAIGELKAQRDQYRTELDRVRGERDKARSLLLRIGAVAAVVGAFVGGALVYLLKRD